MHPMTSEIIEKAAEMADFECKRLSSDINAYIIKNKRRVSFMSSPWNIYPVTRATDSSLFRYKELCYKAMKAWEIQAVHAEYLGSDLSSLTQTIKGSEIDYPCVVKINAGSGSQGIHILKNESEATQLSGEITTNDTDYCLQSYIDQAEYRIFIDHGLVRFAYKRNFISADTKDRSKHVIDTNFTPRFDAIPDYIRQWAYELYKKTSAPIIGADVFIGDDFDTEQEITVLELNHNPGLGVLYEAGHKTEIVRLLSNIFLQY